MKKPKKTTAAAPRARRTASSGSKSGAKTRKATEAETTPKPKKTPARPIGKTVRAAESTPPAESGRAIEMKAPIESMSPAKPRRPKMKSPAGTASTREMERKIETKPASLAGLVAEARSVSERPAFSIASSEAREATRSGRKAPSRVPSILFEGDKPEAVRASGPGQRYALGPTAPVEKLQTEGELPESYGTGELLLTARDPHWLYTHWDLSDDQQRRYNAFSRDGHLVVRVYVDAPGRKPSTEVHVHPESRHWFVHVEQANTRYVAQLGYYSAAERWTVVATSSATLTPPDAVSAETSAEFTAIPFEVPMEKLVSLVKEAVSENAPLARALQELRSEGHVDLPQIQALPQPRVGSHPWFRGVETASGSGQPSEWTAAQERALAAVISMDHVRRVWMGSLEITELIRRQYFNEIASLPGAELHELAPGAPTSPSAAITGISSPSAKAVPPERGFWFNVNAELIVYGATEKDATVSIGGRKIKLRADGSFSYRFALPDGRYEMPIVAISADQTDGRAAEMKFSRSTEYRGQVGAHPQDPGLQQLLLENF